MGIWFPERYPINYLIKWCVLKYCWLHINCWNLKQLSNRIVYVGNYQSVSPNSTGFVNPNLITGIVPDHSLFDDGKNLGASIQKEQ